MKGKASLQRVPATTLPVPSTREKNQQGSSLSSSSCLVKRRQATPPTVHGRGDAREQPLSLINRDSVSSSTPTKQRRQVISSSSNSTKANQRVQNAAQLQIGSEGLTTLLGAPEKQQKADLTLVSSSVDHGHPRSAAAQVEPVNQQNYCTAVATTSTLSTPPPSVLPARMKSGVVVTPVRLSTPRSSAAMKHIDSDSLTSAPAQQTVRRGSDGAELNVKGTEAVLSHTSQVRKGSGGSSEDHMNRSELINGSSSTLAPTPKADTAAKIQSRRRSISAELSTGPQLASAPLVGTKGIPRKTNRRQTTPVKTPPPPNRPALTNGADTVSTLERKNHQGISEVDNVDDLSLGVSRRSHGGSTPPPPQKRTSNPTGLPTSLSLNLQASVTSSINNNMSNAAASSSSSHHTAIGQTLAAIRPMAPVVHVRIRPVIPSLGESNKTRHVYVLDHENIVIANSKANVPSSSAFDCYTAKRGNAYSKNMGSSGSGSPRHQQLLLGRAAPMASGTSAGMPAIKTTTLSTSLHNTPVQVTSSLATSTNYHIDSGIADTQGSLQYVSLGSTPPFDTLQPFSFSPAPLLNAHQREGSWFSQGSGANSDQPLGSHISGNHSNSLSPHQPILQSLDSLAGGCTSSSPQKQQLLASLLPFSSEDVFLPIAIASQQQQQKRTGGGGGNRKNTSAAAGEAPRSTTAAMRRPSVLTTAALNGGRRFSRSMFGVSAVSVSALSMTATSNKCAQSASDVPLPDDASPIPSGSTPAVEAEQHYSFEFVHNDDATQTDVFEESVLRFADEALLAQNVAIMCYGPTGSGKTYSMMGSQGASAKTGRQSGRKAGESGTVQLESRFGDDGGVGGRMSGKVEDGEWAHFGFSWQRGHTEVSPQSTRSASTDRAGVQGGEMGILPRLVHTLLERRGEAVTIHRDPTSVGGQQSSGSSALRNGPHVNVSSSTKSDGAGGKGSTLQSSPGEVKLANQTPSARLSPRPTSSKVQDISLTLRDLTFYGIELYMDEICDLLDPGKRPILTVSDTGGLATLCKRINEARDYRINRSRGGSSGGTASRSSTSAPTPRPAAAGGGMPITSLADLRRAYSLAHGNRVTSKHAKNDTSSRSHAIFLLQLDFDLVEGDDEQSGQRVSSYVAMVDLAGCERVKQTKVEGAALREAQYINKSLSTLSSVVLSLHRNSSHVPYRDSKLTRLLRPCLEGGRVLTLVHVAPCSSTDTVSTLKFADQIRHTHIPMHALTTTSSKHRELLDIFTDLVDPLQGLREAQVRQTQQQLDRLCADIRLAYFSRALGDSPSSLPINMSAVSLNSDGVSEVSTFSDVEEAVTPSPAACPLEEAPLPLSSAPTWKEQRQFAVRSIMHRLMGPVQAYHRDALRDAVLAIRSEKEYQVQTHKEHLQQQIACIQAEVVQLTLDNQRLAEENRTPLPQDPYALQLSKQVKEITEELGECTKEQTTLSSLVAALRQRLTAQDDLEAAVDEQLADMQQRTTLAMKTLTASPSLVASPADLTLISSFTLSNTSLADVTQDPELRDIGHQQVSLAKELAALRLETACYDMSAGLWEGLWARAMRKEILTALEVDVYAMERILLDRRALSTLMNREVDLMPGEETPVMEDLRSKRAIAVAAKGETSSSTAITEKRSGLRNDEGGANSSNSRAAAIWARLGNYLHNAAATGESGVDSGAGLAQVIRDPTVSSSLTSGASQCLRDAKEEEEEPEGSSSRLHTVEDTPQTRKASASGPNFIDGLFTTPMDPDMSLAGMYDDEQAMQETCIRLMTREGIPCEVCCVGETAQNTLDHYMLSATTTAAPSGSGRRRTPKDTRQSPRSTPNATPNHANHPGAAAEQDDGTTNYPSHSISNSSERHGHQGSGCTTRWGRLRLTRFAKRPHHYALEFVYTHQGIPLSLRAQAALHGKTEDEMYATHKTGLEQMVDALPTVHGKVGRGGSKLQGLPKEHRLFSIPLYEPSLHLDVHVLEEGIAHMMTPVGTEGAGGSHLTSRRAHPHTQVVLELQGIPFSSSTRRMMTSSDPSTQTPRRRSDNTPFSMNGVGNTPPRHAVGRPATSSRRSFKSGGGPSGTAASAAPGATTTSTAPANASLYKMSSQSPPGTRNDLALARRLASGGELILPSSCILSNVGSCTLVLRFPEPLFSTSTRVASVEAIVGALCGILRPSTPARTVVPPAASSASVGTPKGSAVAKQRRRSSTTTVTSPQISDKSTPKRGGDQRERVTPVHQAPLYAVVPYPHVPYALLASTIADNAAKNARRYTATNPTTAADPGSSCGSIAQSDSLDGLDVEGDHNHYLGLTLHSSSSTCPNQFRKQQMQSEQQHQQASVLSGQQPQPHTIGASLQVRFYWAPTPLALEEGASDGVELEDSLGLLLREGVRGTHMQQNVTAVQRQFRSALYTMAQLSYVVLGASSDANHSPLFTSSHSESRAHCNAMLVAAMLRQLDTYRHRIQQLFKKQLYDAEDIMGDATVVGSSTPLSELGRGTHVRDIYREVRQTIGLFLPLPGISSPLGSAGSPRSDAFISPSKPIDLTRQSSEDSSENGTNDLDIVISVPDAREACGATVPWTIWQWAYRWRALLRHTEAPPTGPATFLAGKLTPWGKDYGPAANPIAAVAEGSLWYSPPATGLCCSVEAVTPNRHEEASSSSDEVYVMEGDWLAEARWAAKAKRVSLPCAISPTVPSYLEGCALESPVE